MSKKLVIINSDNFELIASIESYFSDKDVEIVLAEKLSADIECDLVVNSGYEYLENSDILCVFPSLLPSFKTKEPLKDAYLSGVKVSGISVVQNDKILAQYPVLIGNSTHYDEYVNEILAVAKKLYPPVIDAILNDRVFDFSDLFKNSCQRHGNCSGNCSSCHNC